MEQQKEFSSHCFYCREPIAVEIIKFVDSFPFCSRCNQPLLKPEVRSRDTGQCTNCGKTTHATVRRGKDRCNFFVCYYCLTILVDNRKGQAAETTVDTIVKQSMKKKIYRDFDWLNQRYTVENLSTDEIAAWAGCAPSTISNWIKKLNIPIKTQGPHPIYPTEEQLTRMCGKEQEMYHCTEIGYPDLVVATESFTPELKRFIIRGRQQQWKNHYEKISFMSQFGNYVLVVQYYRHRAGPNHYYVTGPRAKIFGIRSSIDYYTYMQTDEWRQKSLDIRGRIGKCQACGRRRDLCAHHNTYDNLGDEQEYDLVVLCKDCHELFHTYRDFFKATFSWVDLEGVDFQNSKMIDWWRAATSTA